MSNPNVYPPETTPQVPNHTLRTPQTGGDATRVATDDASSSERRARVESLTARQRAQTALTAARESVGHGLEAARSKASAIGSGIKGTADKAKHRAELVKAGAAERYQGARRNAVRLANDGETWVKEHPTRSVFGALAIGTVAGFFASRLVRRRRQRVA